MQIAHTRIHDTQARQGARPGSAAHAVIHIHIHTGAWRTAVSRYRYIYTLVHYYHNYNCKRSAPVPDPAYTYGVGSSRVVARNWCAPAPAPLRAAAAADTLDDGDREEGHDAVDGDTVVHALGAGGH